MIGGWLLLVAIVGTDGAIEVINGASLLNLVMGIAFSAPRVYSSHVGTFFLYQSTLIGMNEIRGFGQCAGSDYEILG